MEALGTELASLCSEGTVVTLAGELGVGKSVLARAIARALGVTDRMPSPSYTLVEEYPGDPLVLHIDLYRLTDAEEFALLGLDDSMGSAVSLVEWADRAPELLHQSALRVTILFDTENPACRSVTVERRPQ